MMLKPQPNSFMQLRGPKKGLDLTLSLTRRTNLATISDKENLEEDGSYYNSKAQCSEGTFPTRARMAGNSPKVQLSSSGPETKSLTNLQSVINKDKEPSYSEAESDTDSESAEDTFRQKGNYLIEETQHVRESIEQLLRERKELQMAHRDWIIDRKKKIIDVRKQTMLLQNPNIDFKRRHRIPAFVLESLD